MLGESGLEGEWFNEGPRFRIIITITITIMKGGSDGYAENSGLCDGRKQG